MQKMSDLYFTKKNFFLLIGCYPFDRLSVLGTDILWRNIKLKEQGKKQPPVEQQISDIKYLLKRMTASKIAD